MLCFWANVFVYVSIAVYSQMQWHTLMPTVMVVQWITGWHSAPEGSCPSHGTILPGSIFGQDVLSSHIASPVFWATGNWGYKGSIRTGLMCAFCVLLYFFVENAIGSVYYTECQWSVVSFAAFFDENKLIRLISKFCNSYLIDCSATASLKWPPAMGYTFAY